MTQEIHPPLDHKPIPAAPPPSPLLIVVAGVLSFLLWLPAVGQIVWLGPRFEKQISDFKMKVPLLTELVVHHSRWAVPTVVITTLLVGIGLGRRSSWPWLFLLFLLPLAVNIVVGVSVYFPYMELLEGLGGGKK